MPTRAWCIHTQAKFHSSKKPRKPFAGRGSARPRAFDRVQHIYGGEGGDLRGARGTFVVESRFGREKREARSVSHIFFFLPFASMSITAIRVTAASRQRHAAPSKPRDRREKTGGSWRGRMEKGRPRKLRAVYASLVSLMVIPRAILFHGLKEINACLGALVSTRPRNSPSRQTSTRKQSREAAS